MGLLTSRMGNAAIVERRNLWFLLSFVLILPGILLMAWRGVTGNSLLPLSIDYTGGVQWEIRFDEPASPEAVRAILLRAGLSDTTAFQVQDDRTVQLKLKAIDNQVKERLEGEIETGIGPFDEQFFRNIGPAIGSEVSRAAGLAILVAVIGILIYITAAFRHLNHATRYGACAVFALAHDVLVTLSFISIMSLVAAWEVDALFLTAVLTVIGFSVNDTIVVFDRIRENQRRYQGESFARIANRSLVETLQRSLATQVTALLVLVAILVLGGATLQQFMATLIVGLVSGTYSSLCNATPILVAWEERRFLVKVDVADPVPAPAA